MTPTNGLRRTKRRRSSSSGTTFTIASVAMMAAAGARARTSAFAFAPSLPSMKSCRKSCMSNHVSPAARVRVRPRTTYSTIKASANGGNTDNTNNSSNDNADVGDATALPYFDRIGRPRHVLAPMVSQSDLPFRLLCRKYGSGLSYTQMIHAKNYLKSEDFRSNHLDVYRKGCVIDEGMLSGSQMNCLDGRSRKFGSGGFGRHKEEFLAENSDMEGAADHPSLRNPIQPIVYPNEGPVVVQLAGHDPNLVSTAALDIVQRTQGNLAAIDLNCGCPQAIARKGRYGAFLNEEEPELVCDILSMMRKTLPSSGVGLSVKIRLPLDESQMKERIRRLVDSGADLITVHGRNLKENKTKVQHANWDAIAEAARIAREHSGNPDYPIIANGGIEYHSDIDRCLAHTGASAVMSSESLLENPALFATTGPYALEETEMTSQQRFERQISLVEEYLDLCVLYPPVPGSLGKVGGSFNVVRSHVFKMLYRYLEEQPDLRTKLADNETTSIPVIRQITEELRSRYGELSPSAWEQFRSSELGASWYRRHRDAAGRVHRRGGSHINGASFEPSMSLEDKKRIMKERIQKLKAQRLNKAELSLSSEDNKVAA